ncbi:hypothetical protein JCM11641_004566, partial [Rhodosporidiobolus odoratus]
RGVACHITIAHRRGEARKDNVGMSLEDLIWWDGVERRSERRRRAVNGDDSDPEEEDEAQERKFTIEQYEGAALPCDAAGNYVDPSPKPPQSQTTINDASNPFFPFDTGSQIRWADLILRHRWSETATDDLLDVIEEE